MVDALTAHGVRAKTEAQHLYRRMVFNVLVSNVDDHLSNHGFLWVDRNGWSLSPAYDLNLIPTDLKERVLTTNIDLDESPCSTDPVESSASYFGFVVGCSEGGDRWCRQSNLHMAKRGR